MRKFDSRAKDLLFWFYQWSSQVADPIRAVRGLCGFTWFFQDWLRYGRAPGAEEIKIANAYPCLHDKTEFTHFDRHYFYQDIWAFRRIYESGCKHHVDVGSRIDFVGFLTAITRVTMIDIRPLLANLQNLESKKGSILQIPYASGTIRSLSCLHVAEHIGLGRYGDPLDPAGTKKAAQELSRVLSPGGNLFFSLPIGKPRLCFNAHRIHRTDQILEYFSGLTLVEFSGIDDEINFRVNIGIGDLDSCNYGCGLFWFKKP